MWRVALAGLAAADSLKLVVSPFEQTEGWISDSLDAPSLPIVRTYLQSKTPQELWGIDKCEIAKRLMGNI